MSILIVFIGGQTVGEFALPLHGTQVLSPTMSLYIGLQRIMGLQ